MKILASAAFLALALAAGPATAQSDSLRLSLDYDGKLLVKVFELHLDQQVTASRFESKARFTSYGVLAAFKKLDQRVSSEGAIVRGNPMPGRFWFQNFAGEKKRRVETVWSGGSVTTTARPTYVSWGEPPASPAQKRAAADPLTQLTRMTLNGSRGDVCNRTTRFFDGKQLYDLVFSHPRTVAPGKREKQLGLVDVQRCDVRFIEVAGFKAKPPEKRDQGLKYGIQIEFGQAGARGPWVVSAMRAKTPLGRAVIELKRLSIQGRDPTG